MKLMHSFLLSISIDGAILNKLFSTADKAIEIMRATGIYQPLGGIHYFMPHPLPPKDPPLAFDADMMALYEEASFALGQLNQLPRKATILYLWFNTIIFQASRTNNLLTALLS